MAEEKDERDQRNTSQGPEESAGSEPASETNGDRTTRVIEVFAALLLSLAAVAAAWSGYQSARWGGVQATDTAEANTFRLEASRATATGGQLAQIDIGTFFQAVNAFASDDQKVLDFYVERMRPEFQLVFEEWVALDPQNNPDAPLSPFELDSYTIDELKEAERFDQLAEEETQNAGEARERANQYTISVVLLAAALFFAGISTKFSANRARIALLGVGGVIFVVVLIYIVALPDSVAL